MASIAPVSKSAACVKPSGANVVSRRNMKYVTMIKMKRLVRVGAIVPREVVVTEGIARVKENQQVSYRKAERTHPCEWYAGNSCHDNNFVEPKILAIRFPKLSLRAKAVDNKSIVSVKTTMPDK